MRIIDETIRLWQWVRLGTLVFGHHFVKVIGNWIDREDGVIEQQVAKRMSRRMLEVLGLDVHVEGLEHVRDLRNYAIVSNHTSYLDWVLLLAEIPQGLRFIAKKEATWMPVFGSYLRNRGILIDRKKGASARTVIRAGAKVESWPIVLFAEGTRSGDGEVKKFRRAGLRILAEEKVTLVPVVLLGTHEALAKDGRAIRYGRKIAMLVGEPVDSASLGVEDSVKQVEARVRALHAARRAEFVG